MNGRKFEKRGSEKENGKCGGGLVQLEKGRGWENSIDSGREC